MSFEGADIHALHRLIYFSRAAVNSADDLAPMMGSILSAAVPRNAGCGVSGALLACDKWFVQALEGDRLTVGEVYNLICSDRRHRETTVIKAGPIERRSFDGWSMCGQTLSPTDDAIIRTLETRKAFDPASLSVTSALKLLEVVRNLQTKPPPSAYV
ncbi:MAG: BLUF domain-containing protein [Pseudomonadota bacterium]